MTESLTESLADLQLECSRNKILCRIGLTLSPVSTPVNLDEADNVCPAILVSSAGESSPAKPATLPAAVNELLWNKMKDKHIKIAIFLFVPILISKSKSVQDIDKACGFEL